MHDTLTEAINKYLAKGFGAMNKNDFEVFVFNTLMARQEYTRKSDYDFSLMLKIPESKIKRLRYEAKLKYGIDMDNMKDNISSALEHSHIVSGKDRCIEICIDDEATRKYISAELKKDYRFGDSSFNNDIIRLTIEDYIFLLHIIYGDDEVNKIEKNIKKKAQKGDTFSLSETIKEAIVNTTVSNTIDLALKNLPLLIQQLLNL